jgi:hypothetical protein
MTSLTYEVIQSTAAEISNMTVFALDQQKPFDADDYAEWAGLNRADIDPADIHAIQDAQSQLGKDFWMIVSH